MAKRITKPKERAVEPAWYTVRWSYPEPLRGGAVGGSLEVRAKDEAEAQATVEAKLRAKGHTWKDITIVKGRDPGLTRKGGTERHYAELQTMLGIGRLALHAWSDIEPRPMWAGPDIMPDPDATARTGWAKFMDESSYGLSVSAFPRFIIPDVEGHPTLPLPAVDVRNPKRWEAITSAVRDQLDYWKGTLQERIERLGKAKRRSKEEAAQMKRDKAALKQLQAFDGWNYQAFVGAMLPGRKPDPRDLDNLRLYWLSNGQLIPITNLGRDQLKVDFWRRLLSLWDGPVDKRADLVRGFLDHHHLTGGKAEVFRDLVKDTAARLRGMVSKGASLRDAERWGLLADKLEGWLSDAAERLTATLSRPTPYVFVTGAGGERWSKEAHLPILEQRQGPMEPVTASVRNKASIPNGSRLTIAEIARLCWCMEKAGHEDHRILNASSAIRLAGTYGQLHERAGEKLKQERDRFDASDGRPFLAKGANMRPAYGRKVWGSVKAELIRLGYSGAADHAEGILREL